MRAALASSGSCADFASRQSNALLTRGKRDAQTEKAERASSLSVHSCPKIRTRQQLFVLTRQSVDICDPPNTAPIRRSHHTVMHLARRELLRLLQFRVDCCELALRLPSRCVL